MHQRERGAIITQPPNPASPGDKRWSRSAPDLEKPPLRNALLASAQRSPLLQEIGNTKSRKLYSSANNLVDTRSGSNASATNQDNSDDFTTELDHTNEETNFSSDSHGITKVSFNFDNDENYCHFVEQTDNSINLVHISKINQRTQFADEQTYSELHGDDKSKISKNMKYSPIDSDYTVHTSNFVQSFVGTARRVKNKKRDRSKSKEKRRDSSESRLNSLADFFKSPSGSRKSSINSSRSVDRKNSLMKINAGDGCESSPENSIGKPLKHKSRSSKSPMRVLRKITAWGSRDTLDDQEPAKVEYNVLENAIHMPGFDQRYPDRDQYPPSFLAVHSREGIDFENLESELCNLDSEHSNDSSKSKNSAQFLDEFERCEPRSSIDSSKSKSSLTSKYSGQYSDRDPDNDSMKINLKSKSNEFLLNFGENSTSSRSEQPMLLQDYGRLPLDPNYCLNESSAGSFKIMSISRRSSDATNSVSSVTSSILATEKFYRKNK